MKKKQSFRRQAVVVIHGIGNQQPMDTLRGFVSRLLEPDDKMYSSPNRLTDNLELRKLSIGHKNTDFYEFYWANLVKDVPITDIFVWMIKLIKIGVFMPNTQFSQFQIVRQSVRTAVHFIIGFEQTREIGRAHV